MLKISDLHVNYGGINALRGISLEVPDGEIVLQDQQGKERKYHFKQVRYVI